LAVPFVNCSPLVISSGAIIAIRFETKSTIGPKPLFAAPATERT
jgi:hypothetical protein